MHSVLIAALAATVLGQDLTTQDVASSGNNTLFTRWRPTSHIMAPAGWMNDPCGYMYDPVADLYHAFYQWHPEHVNWGNISWGHAISDDLISWTDVTDWEGYDAQALGPSGTNDTYAGLGIFSGTAQPVNLNGEQDGNLTMFYTAVQYLPISWNKPYITGSEKLALATSSDGGVTWQQYEGNPVVSGPPDGWNITGWRDPFFQPWPLLDAVIGQDEPHYYAVMGSGIKGVGPRIPLYSAPASDLTNWTFLGSLYEPVDNTSFGDNYFVTGSNGFNWEVSGFFSLTDDDGHEHYYINMGTEGGNVSFHESEHWALHYEGIVSRRANGSVAFNPISGGPADYGLLYALSSFNDTKNDRRLLIGWAPEDIIGDGGSFSALQQGFQGSHGLPRELFVQISRNIVNNDGTLLELGPSYISENGDGTFNARSLGMRVPEDILLGLRNGTVQHTFNEGNFGNSTTLLSNGSSHFELSATMTNVSGRAGFRIALNPDESEYTTIWFDPSNYTVAVDRSSSSQIEGFNNATVWGYFRPWYRDSADDECDGPVSEPVNWHIFLDGSLLEILINDRFAMTTRIYPGCEASNGIGIFVDDGASAYFDNIAVWSELYNVWPERPLNSSSPLQWDTPAETDNYLWWTGD